MIKLYKGCFFIYRITLALLIVFVAFNNMAGGSSRHNIDYDIPDLVLIIFGIITVTFISLLHRPGIGVPMQRAIRYTVVTFVLATIFFDIYFLYYTFFICRCFAGGDIFISVLLVVFTAVSTISFLALAKNKI